MNDKSLNLVKKALSNLNLKKETIEVIAAEIRKVEKKETGEDTAVKRKDLKVRLSANLTKAEEQLAMLKMGKEQAGLTLNDFILRSALRTAKRRAWREPMDAFQSAIGLQVFDQLPDDMQEFLMDHENYKKKYSTLRFKEPLAPKRKKKKAEEE